MANVTFSKLGLKKKEEVKKIIFNEQEIEVKQYLPIQDKLNVMFNAISKTEDENRFFNPVKLECYCTLEIIYAYTNIKFTDKQLEDEGKLFDLMEENDLINLIFSAIPEDETDFIMNSCERAAEAIYTYNNSIVGVHEKIKNKKEKFEINTDNLINTLKDPTAFDFIQKLINFENGTEED